MSKNDHEGGTPDAPGEDVEGHKRHFGHAIPDDEPEGQGQRVTIDDQASEEDVEGHKRHFGHAIPDDESGQE